MYVMNPLQASILSRSASSSGSCLRVSLMAFPLRHRIARLSPALATTSSFPLRSRPTVAVVPVFSITGSKMRKNQLKANLKKLLAYIVGVKRN